MDLNEFQRLENELRGAEQRRLLIADGVLVGLAVLAYCIAPKFLSGEAIVWIKTACFVVGVFQVAVVTCLAAEALGVRVDYSLGIGPTPAGGVFIKELKDRSPMSDDEFFQRYGDRVPLMFEQVARLRSVLRNLDPLCDHVEPQEVVAAILYDFDFEDLYFLLAREFGIDRVAPASRYSDGTLMMVFTDVENALTAARLAIADDASPASRRSCRR